MQLLNNEVLLAPLSENNPVGVDLREDASPNSLYYQIKDARSLARTIERQRMQDDTTEKPDAHWETVFQLGIKILSSSSKDLEITAWLMEALLRLHELSGLAEGLQLAYELVEKYWDTIYPRLDEDGFTARVAPFTMLNGIETDGSLIVPILSIPITNGKDENFVTWQYQQAVQISQISDPQKREKRLSEGSVALSDIKQIALNSSPVFFRNRLSNTQACLDNLTKFSLLLDEKCKLDSPPISKIRNSLREVLDALQILSKDVLVDDSIDDISDESQKDESATKKKNNATGTDELNNREQAFKALKQISDFFRKTEPQSIVPYILDKAVRWGKQSFPDLLDELISDSSTKDLVFRVLDVEKTDS